MRTESDLRAALSTLERQSPDPAVVLAALDATPDPAGRATRRRRLTMIAVAAATAAALAAVPAVRALTDRAGTAGKPRPGWHYTYTLALPSGWKLVREQATAPGVQSALVAPTGVRWDRRCTLTSFDPGRFDPAVLTGPRRPVTLAGGRQGYLTDAGEWRLIGESTDHPVLVHGTRPVVAWEYAPGAWRLSDCALLVEPQDRGPAARQRMERFELELARSVLDGARAVPSPVRLGYLPPGWEDRRIRSRETEAGGADWALDAYATGSGPRVFPELVRPAAPLPGPQTGSVEYRAVVVAWKRGAPDERRGTPMTIDGMPAWLSETGSGGSYYVVLTIQGPGYTISVTAGRGPQTLTRDVLKIARSLRIAPDPLDERTWFDANDAIP